MSKVVFEAAALADALTKAAKIAPTRGEAFEKSAGVVLDLTADEAIIMATDGLVRYSTWLTPESYEGDPTIWRVSSRIFPDAVSKLKTNREKMVTLEQDGRVLKMSHARTRATFHMMDASRYARWSPFSPDDMFEVTGLSKAVGQVEWAANKNGDPPLVGVYLDGTKVIATNRYRFAVAPCEIKLDEPIVVPPGAITGVLRATQSVMMRVEGKQVYLMPDDFTQIALTAYGVEYVPVEKVMLRDQEVRVTVDKSELSELIDYVSTMIGANRMPTIVLIFGRQQIAAMVDNAEEGRMGGVLDTPGHLDFPNRREIRFKPENLSSVLSGSPGSEVTIAYNPDNPYAPVYFDGGGEGVEFWLAPQQKVEPGTEE